MELVKALTFCQLQKIDIEKKCSGSRENLSNLAQSNNKK